MLKVVFYLMKLDWLKSQFIIHSKCCIQSWRQTKKKSVLLESVTGSSMPQKCLVSWYYLDLIHKKNNLEILLPKFCKVTLTERLTNMKRHSDKCLIGILNLLKLGTFNIKTVTKRDSSAWETFTVTLNTLLNSFKNNPQFILTRLSVDQYWRTLMDNREVSRCSLKFLGWTKLTNTTLFNPSSLLKITWVKTVQGRCYWL